MNNRAVRGFTRGLSKTIDALCATIPVGRVLGVPIGITVGLILLATVDAIQSFENLQYLVIAISSVFLHELGHVYVAQREGCKVHSIKLDIIGGTAQMDIPIGTSKEFRIAIAGPLVSFALFLIAFNTYRLFPYEILGKVGLINSMVAGFNLLPGFPMDGGRILRSFLAKYLGLLRATKIAVQVARVFFVLLGLTAIILGNYLLILVAVLMWLYGASELRSVKRSERIKEQELRSKVETKKEYRSVHEKIEQIERDTKRRFACMLLEIDSKASKAEIQQAYRRVVRKLHPDLHPHVNSKRRKVLESQFIAVVEAYKTLQSDRR